MILYPWHSPIALSRAWCVYELFAAVEAKAEFEITLPPSQTHDFIRSSQDNPRQFYNTIASLKSENCAASKKEDLDAIHKAIRDAETVYSASWISARKSRGLGDRITIVSRLGEAHSLTGLGQYEKAEKLFLECEGTVKQERFRKEDDFALATFSGLAAVYNAQGKYEQARAHHQMCWEIPKSERGEYDLNTLTSWDGMAVAYVGLGRNELAIPIHRSK
ncbi:Kinesin light chain 3 [Rhizophlyctis rosea]|nr:Kinesin light chain 3 [Rhizophlyctis rosea]